MCEHGDELVNRRCLWGLQQSEHVAEGDEMCEERVEVRVYLHGDGVLVVITEQVSQRAEEHHKDLLYQEHESRRERWT